MTEVTASGGLVPQNFDQAMRFAEMMSRSKMIPVSFQGKPEECLVIVEQAMRWAMSPYAVIQCASMVHNRPMYEGKLVAAVVNSRGPYFGLHGRLRYEYSGEAQQRMVTVLGNLNGKEQAVEIHLKDAQTSNEHWKKQPDQQLAYHGARVWARRHMPELMLGVYAPEEFARGAPLIVEDFAGTTIEVTAQTVTPTASPSPPPTPEKPRRTYRELLTAITVAAKDAPTEEEIVALGETADVRLLYEHANQDVRDELSQVLAAAMARVREGTSHGTTADQGRADTVAD